MINNETKMQVGYQVVPERKLKKPELGHLKKAECPPMRHLLEFRVSARFSLACDLTGLDLG
jgi:hypothetical protein